MKRLQQCLHVTIGADPEGFLYRGDTPIESREVLAKPAINKYGKVCRDGFQFEVQPRPMLCAALAANNLEGLLETFANNLTAYNITHRFARAIELDAGLLQTIDEESRQLGCEASDNVYGLRALDIPNETYPIRSGGGHIHLGIPQSFHRNITTLVPLLDILVGTSGVLLDQDVGNQVRRRLYGLPGEFRKPSYGVEYRTLSNFWLESGKLMRFVLGMAELAVTILPHDDIIDKLAAAVDITAMQTAILQNDYDSAQRVMRSIQPILEDALPEVDTFVLNAATVKNYIDAPLDFVMCE